MLSIACMYITGGPIFPIDPHSVEKRKVEQDELWTAKAIPGKERKMSHPPAFTVRADDLLRHLQDLRSGTYDGAMSRGEDEVVYRRGVELFSPGPVATSERANTLFLKGTGAV